MNVIHRPNAITSFCLAATLSIMVVMAIHAAVYSSIMERDTMIGWSVAIVLHAMQAAIFGRAVRQSTSTFLAMALGGIFLRLFVLIILIVIVLVGGKLQVTPFLIGLLPAYIIGISVEVAHLATGSNVGTSGGN